MNAMVSVENLDMGIAARWLKEVLEEIYLVDAKSAGTADRVARGSFLEHKCSTKFSFDEDKNSLSSCNFRVAPYSGST
jgi:hypothetical protein